MEQFIIKGPNRLNGSVKISGSKNSALPIIAATTLFKKPVTLKNVPRINDVFALLKILEHLGAICEFNDHALTINCKNLKKKNPDPKIIRNLRASILFLSPLLVRNKEVALPHPGGCLIGARPIDLHLKGLTKMGAESKTEDELYKVKAGSLKPAEVTVNFSVGATENLIFASVLTKGVTKIKLAACEPHVQDLCNFLNKAGAKIDGVGTHYLEVNGVVSLDSIEYGIIPDQIEAGTFAIAAAVCKGEVEIDGFIESHQEALLAKFEDAGIIFSLSKDKIKIKPAHLFNSLKIRTEIAPGFPTDLQAPMAVLATQANGTSEIYETIFEGRLGYIAELNKMGANAVIRDAHQATITGPTPLTGTRITSFDLRAGATLIIAALIARGESRLDQIEIIDRGYEDIEGKFRSVGANIKRIALKEVE